MQTINFAQPKTPVTFLISTIMIIISSLFIFRQSVYLPCGSDLLSTFSRNFIHVDPLHLIINLYGFYQLANLEFSLGSIHYLSLIFLLAIIQTILEHLYQTITPFPTNCSIGFSGILFGILTFIFFKKAINPKLLLALFVSILSSSATDPQISLIGHLFGLIAGLLVVVAVRIIGWNYSI